MTTDQAVTKDLIETLEDGREGFAKGAEKLDADNAADLAATFRKFSEQRSEFSAELSKLAAEYGDHVDESGSVAAKLHRGWLAVKDVLAGSSNPSGVLDAAEQGEDHAVKEYEQALAEDVSAELRSVIERQFAEIKTAHDQIRRLRDSHQ